jgi:hypothetical protein
LLAGAGARRLRPRVERHLRIALPLAQSVTHNLQAIERVNVQSVIDRWAGESNPPVEPIGYSATGYVGHDRLVQYLNTNELIQGPVERAQFETGPQQTLDCVQRGLYFFRRQETPVVIAFRSDQFTRAGVIEVIAATRAAAQVTLSTLLNEAQRESVYRGRTLSLEQASSPFEERVGIRFHEVRPTRREDIVLPDDLIRVVERNVLGMLKHAEVLRRAGQSLRRGLLFHGPPGTGKTMMVRYVTQACPDHTVILLTGNHLGLVRDSCQVARMLAPSIVVLEDVDLVAEEREHNRFPTILHELLNEMDGIALRDQVMFLLTTNRPEILEKALAARPGRVDQAVAFPLPDESCRRRLFELYGRGMDLSALDLPRWLGQTAGVSPAFIEELLRKAALMAAERGESTSPLRLSDVDVQDAIRELVCFGGELTQKLLGYGRGRFGFQATGEL